MRMLTLSLAAMLAAMPAAAQEETQDISPVQVWKGDDSRIEAAEYLRVTDVEAWSALWERHQGRKGRAPNVDFTRNMVVACFLGQRPQHHVDFYRAVRTKEELVLGVMLEEGECCDFSKRPLYFIAVLPKLDDRISVIARLKQEFDVDPRRDELLHEMPAVGK